VVSGALLVFLEDALVEALAEVLLQGLGWV